MRTPALTEASGVGEADSRIRCSSASNRTLRRNGGFWTAARGLKRRFADPYQRAATEHFAARGVQAEVIYVQGSVEIAPLVGLADLIVDLVESGATLRDNGLVEKETIASISSVLVANPSLYKLRYTEIEPLVSKLRQAVEQARTRS